jgi:hypothetical protein
MGGEQISGPSDGQRNLKGLTRFIHKSSGSFQDRERGMPFIQVTDFRLDAKRDQQSPTADSQQ